METYTGKSVNGTPFDENGNVNVTSGSSPQTVISYPANFTGTNYNLQASDNGTIIYINNGTTPVTITIPSGLPADHEVYYIQEGLADVSFVDSGTTINSPEGKIKISKQYGWACTIQKGTSNLFNLLGLLKA